MMRVQGALIVLAATIFGQVAQAELKCSPAMPSIYPPRVREFLEARPQYVEKWSGQFPTLFEAYFKGRVSEDWGRLNPELPATAESVLDIGSGVGGIDAMMAQCYAKADFTLVDMNDRPINGQTFNILAAARELMTVNNLGSERFRFESASTFLNSKANQYDVVISLRALAYTFPYATYRDFLKKNLRKGGTLIIDVARWTPEQLSGDSVSRRMYLENPHEFEEIKTQLEADFGPAKTIKQGNDYVRLVIRRIN